MNGIKGTHLVFLEDSFRKRLFEEAVAKAGSKHQLRFILGYLGQANLNGMLDGRIGIPMQRLTRMCNFLKLPLKELDSHVVKVKDESGRVLNIKMEGRSIRL